MFSMARSVSIWISSSPLLFHHSAYMFMSLPELGPPSVAPDEAATTYGREVEPLDRFAYGGGIFHERDLQHRGTQIGEVTEQIYVPRVVDAQVDGYADLIGHVAEIDHLVFRKRTVLAVGHDEAVVVLAEDVFELGLRGGHWC